MKKLSLKRKLPQERQETKIHICQNNTTTDHGESGPKSGKMASEIDEFEQRDPGRSLTGNHDNEVSPIAQKKSVFLGTDDASLNKLRQIILNLAPKERNVPQFPPVFTDLQESDESGNTEWIQGRQQSSSKLCENVELSPFPKVCRHLINSNGKSAASDTKDSFDLSNKLHELSDVPQISSEKCEDSINSVTKTHQSVNSVTKCDRRVNSVTKCDRSVNGVVMEKHTINIHVSTYRENNSNLLRDRNSNLYVLQSQNASIIRSNTQTGNSNVHPINSNEHPSNSNVHPSHRNVPSSNRHAVISSKRENVSITDQHFDNVKKHKESKHSAASDSIRPEPASHSVRRRCTDTVHDKTSSGDQLVNDTSINSVTLNTSSGDQSVNDTSLDAVTLKNCPLCQTQFSNRQTQVDIDSHIATCLAASDDSVTW